MKAQQVIVEETLHDDEVKQSCAAIKLGNFIIFADNGFTVDLNEAKHIKIIKELSWINISDAILGN